MSENLELHGSQSETDTKADEYDPLGSFPVEKTNENEIDDHLYDSVDEEDEKTKELTKAEEPTKTEEEPKQNEKDNDDDEEEEEDEYDPTANVSTSENFSLPGLSDTTEETTELAKEEPSEEKEEEDEEDDDEYDPLSSTEPESKVESTSNITPPSTASSDSTQTVPTTAPVADSTPAPSTDAASLTSELTLKLFSDPEFTKLSYADQQKRVLEEFSKLSGNNSISQEQNNSANERGAHRPDFDSPMSLTERNLYNSFLDKESQYHRKYPFKPNSRLYVGNLPANFSKENIFRMFSVYGDLLQISMKNTYAFLQYADADSVLRAVKAEEGIQLYKKDLILEVAKNSRPDVIEQFPHPHSIRTQGNQPQGNQRNQFHESRKRARDEANGYGGNSQGGYHAQQSQFENSSAHGNKRRQNADCQIFIRPHADPNYAKEVSRTFVKNQIYVDFEYVKPNANMEKKINEAAYSGIMSVILVNTNRTLDVFVYESTPDGGIRYDEYMSISIDDAVTLLRRAKEKSSPSSSSSSRYQNHSQNQNQNQGYQNQGYNSNQYNQPQQPIQAPAVNNNLLQSLQNLSPQDLQNLLALAATQQQPAQQYQPAPAPIPQYQQYPPQQQPNTTGVDLTSLLNKLKPQASPVPTQQPQQQYQPYQQAQPVYQPPQPAASYPPAAQQQQGAPDTVASLLATLSHLNQK